MAILYWAAKNSLCGTPSLFKENQVLPYPSFSTIWACLSLVWPRQIVCFNKQIRASKLLPYQWEWSVATGQPVLAFRVPPPVPKSATLKVLLLLNLQFLSHRRLLFFWELAPSAPLHKSYPLRPELNKSNQHFYFHDFVGKSLLTHSCCIPPPLWLAGSTIYVSLILFGRRFFFKHYCKFGSSPPKLFKTH